MEWLEELSEEQKNLLKIDLCARLPYGVKCKYYDYFNDDFDDGTIFGFERRDMFEIDGVCIRIDDVRPYLFPMSSMTVDQAKEFHKLCIEDMFGVMYYTEKSNNYLNENHFDYRGLIPMGLAIDATNLNIY